MAEIELAVLAGHPLKTRMGDQATVEHEVRTWRETCNAKAVTTADARIKLKHFYLHMKCDSPVTARAKCFQVALLADPPAQGPDKHDLKELIGELSIICLHRLIDHALNCAATLCFLNGQSQGKSTLLAKNKH